MLLMLLIHDLYLELQDFNLGNLNFGCTSGSTGKFKNYSNTQSTHTHQLNQNRNSSRFPEDSNVQLRVRVSVLISVPPINLGF